MTRLGAVKAISAARTGSTARKATSHSWRLSAANTLPAASNSTSSTGTESFWPSACARSMVTPVGAPVAGSDCTSTALPRLMAARSRPVGARLFTASTLGWCVVMVHLSVRPRSAAGAAPAVVYIAAAGSGHRSAVDQIGRSGAETAVLAGEEQHHVDDIGRPSRRFD